MTGYDVHMDKAMKELRARLDQAERERDEARAALAGEPARIAAAEMARDALWIRAATAIDVDDAIISVMEESVGTLDDARRAARGAL